MSRELHVIIGPFACPGCGRPIQLGLSGTRVRPGRVSACSGCGTFNVLDPAGALRLPTARERTVIEVSGLGASLREDVERLRQLRRTGTLQPKRIPAPVPEPVF